MFFHWSLQKRSILCVVVFLLGSLIVFWASHKMESGVDNYDYSQIQEYQAEVTDVHVSHATKGSAEYASIDVELIDGAINGSWTKFTLDCSYPVEYEVGDSVTVYADEKNQALTMHGVASESTGGGVYFALMLIIIFVMFVVFVVCFRGKGVALFAVAFFVEYILMEI